MTKLSRIHSDTWIGLGLIILSLVLIPFSMGDYKTWLLPLVCVIGIGLFGLVIALGSFFQKSSSAIEEKDKEKHDELKVERSPWSIRGVLAIILIILPVFAIVQIGFVLSMFLILLGLLVVSGSKWSKAFLISAVTNVVFMVLFTHVIYLPLPLGTGPFRSINLFIMFFTWG